MEKADQIIATSPADTLVVLLHAYTLSPDSLSTIAAFITDELLPGAHIIKPPLPLGRLSFADPVVIARDLVLRIDKEFEKHDYKDIILVGHSVGGLLARKVYLFAQGENPDAPFEGDNGIRFARPRPWVHRVSRIILLAGMNRGWSLSHHMGLANLFRYGVGQFFGHLVQSVFGKRFLIFHVRRGAPFITQLRLQWVALEKRLRKDRELSTKLGEEEKPSAKTIQLLGSIDDVVSPEDNIDMVTGESFVYLDIPFSGHRDVIQLDASPEGLSRREVFRRALLHDVDELRANSPLPGDETLNPEPRDDVEHVIFVIHGIRDVGYWTSKIARRVQVLADSPKPPQVYAKRTATYGYFAMFPFLLPARRREKVEWLMDQYTEARARFPNASFSFVGHSNGTYLLAKALQQYPACRFDRVIFAGSVTRTDYDWIAEIQRGQVTAVLNYLATCDWVVAIFPGALEKLRLQDLGSAGFDGFRQAAQGGIEQHSYIRGGHGAALQEKNWDAIAKFIVNGPPALKLDKLFDAGPNPLVRVLGRFAPLVWLVVAALLLAGGCAIWSARMAEWERTLGLVAYIWCIWKILTRV